MKKSASVVQVLTLCLSLTAAQGLLAQTPHPAATLADIAIYPRISASAIVISPEETDLSARITATVAEVLADVGAVVKKGDTLIRLDCSDYNLSAAMATAQLETAEANRTLAESRHGRSSQLLEQALTSKENADTTAANLAAAKAEVDRAQAALEITQLDKSRCQIVAPFSGTVSQRYVSRGQLAAAGTPLLQLINHQDLEVSAQISERDIHSFNPKTPFIFNGLARYPVTLKSRVQALDKKTRTQEIRLAFSADKPLAGSAGKIAWQSAVPHLGKQYLVSRDGVTGFFTVKDGAARFVALGDFFPEKDHPVNLPLDTVILTGNLKSLVDGAAVDAEIAAPDAKPQKD